MKSGLKVFLNLLETFQLWVLPKLCTDEVLFYWLKVRKENIMVQPKTLCSFMTKFSSAMRRELQLDFIALIILIMISITPEFKKFRLTQQGAIN